MKNLISTLLIVTGLVLVASCTLPPEAGIRITSESENPVEFSGYYGSQVTEFTKVEGVTAASYKVKVNTESDHIRAAFVKKDSTDTESELRVRLFYRGIGSDITIKDPGDSAIIDYKIRK